MKKRRLRLKPWATALIVAAAVFVVFYFISGVWAGFVLAFISALLVWKVDYRAAMVVSIVLLAVCAFLLALNLTSTANALADWAFYVLGVALVMQFIDFLRTSRSSPSRAEGRRDSSLTERGKSGG